MSEFDVTTEGGVTIIKPTTKLDQLQEKSFTKIIDQALENEPVHVVIDFCFLSTVASAGLRLIMKAYKTVIAKDGKFAVCSVNKNIDYLFDLVHLKRDIPIYKDAKDAVEKLS